MYTRFAKERLFSPNCEISSAFDSTDTTGKNLTKEILKRSVGVAKGELRHDSTHFELRRKCACAAYNTLIAVLSNVQDQMKFYDNFLFSESTVKGEAIFESQVDLSKQFQFDVEISFDPTSKNRFVTVRHKGQIDTDPNASSGNNLEEGGRKTVPYVASHYLSDSSLREDLSQFDFSSSVVLSQAVASTSGGFLRY